MGICERNIGFPLDDHDAFLEYLKNIESNKLKNFLLRFKFPNHPMNREQIILIFHALWCLYFRKKFRELELPTDAETKPSCEKFTNKILNSNIEKTETNKIK